MLRRFFTAVTLLVTLAACSGGGGSKTGQAGGDSSSQPSAAATAKRSANATVNPLASGSGVPAVNDPERDRPCDPDILYSGNSGLPGGSYIRADMRGQNSWGPACLELNPNDRCEVLWDGAYNLAIGDKAYLRFQAFAKGTPKAIKEITVGPLEPSNSFRKAGFPVVIPKATHVAFRVVLLDSTKRPVAISDSYSYRINCLSGRH